MSEIVRIMHTIGRRWANPRENPMPLWQMAWFYIQKRIYLHSHRLPAIKVPFAFADGDLSPRPRIAVIVHCFYPDLMEELLTYIVQIPFAYQLYVSTDTEKKRSRLLRQIEQRQISASEVRLTPNRGRDIAPKYITFRDVYDHCDFFLHLHSKKSAHTGSWGEEWRRHLLRTLVGSPKIIRSNLRVLDDPRIGLVFPEPVNDTLPSLRWGANFKASLALARRLNIAIDRDFCWDYPDGSMYWGKAAVVKPLLNLDLKFNDFPMEKGELDGGLSHAIERMASYCAFSQGLSGCRVSIDPAYSRLQNVEIDGTPSKSISACLAAQERERHKYDKLVQET